MATKSSEVSEADSSLTAQQLLSKGLRSAQVEGEYCDLLLSCQGYQWKAHRVVLCSWSSFFKNACKDGFKEGTSGVIDLKEDDPDTVARMLHFCYTYDYQIIVNDKILASDVVVDPMMVNARMYFVADKYDIGPLKNLAKMKFEEVVKEQWRLESFPTVIKAIYENTLPSDSLRVCLVSVVKRHKKELRESIAFMEVVRSGGDFAADVFDAWTNERLRLREIDSQI